MTPNPAVGTEVASAAKKLQATGSRATRLPSLDGWRAFSILLVLESHCHYIANYPRFKNPLIYKLLTGDMGVRCFFIISGFLITWLMIGEDEKEGRVDLIHFYARRALRILPVYFAFMAVLGCLSLLTPFSQTVGNWLANLTFTTNFISSAWPSGHLWSLAVEEQFYLIWPVLFVLANIGKKAKVGFWAAAVPFGDRAILEADYLQGTLSGEPESAIRHLIVL